MKQRSYETKEGEKRTVVELEVGEIGPSLRCATATVDKAARNGSNRGGFNGGGGQSNSGAPADDPWGPQPVGANAGGNNEPPF